ncbi:hypothetical protein FB45DRAFT_1053501 [Roridomyces roridus]|uniref:phytol kinase n=1 Tax=Roridomyces roridus TaxID=1738132 RepID=A0AAD7CCL6_9AGAR|nr:hypothetical protein FB45DRAFT_1053501 [Roridomyces roridus]
MSNPANVKDLVVGAGGTMSHLASLLVKHLRLIIPPPSSPCPDAVLMRVGIVIAAVLNFTLHPPLHDDLASHGIVDVLCSAVFTLGGSSSVFMTATLPLIMSTLVKFMDVLPHTTRVKEALDGGILRAIVLCAGRRDASFFLEQQHALLGSVLSQARVCNSVLGSLRAALNDAKTLTHSSQFRDSKFVGAWQDFVRVATDRLAKFDRGEIDQSRACDNIECISSTGTDEDLKQCSRCQSAFYCSKECQSQDWAAGHRKLCRALPKRENANTDAS